MVQTGSIIHVSQKGIYPSIYLFIFSIYLSNTLCNTLCIYVYEKDVYIPGTRCRSVKVQGLQHQLQSTYSICLGIY
jgi:hypothetical protein